MSGYSKNPATAEKLLPILEPLIQGSLCTWQTVEGYADHYAYKIREALYIARLHRERENLSALARMAEKIRIVVTSPSTVEARFAKGVPEALVLTTAATPTSGLENAGRSVVTLTRQTVRSVQEAWRAQQPSNTPLYFPSAGLSYDELVVLHGWAEEFGLILIEVDGALTVQRTTVDLAAFAWTPQPTSNDVPADEFPFKD